MSRSAKRSPSAGKEITSFLRAINIRQDARAPERIAHYRPTAKSVVLIRALAGLESDRAFMITAPYGSGKSLSATFLLHLVENSSTSKRIVRKIIRERLESVDPQITRWANKRVRANKSGVVLAIEGSQQSVAQGLREALSAAVGRQGWRPPSFLKNQPETMDDALQMLRDFGELAAKREVSPIVIVWDEFGRHVEALVSESRAGQLSEIQQLAEFVARQTNVPFILGLLLHQGLLRYASHLSHSVRAEWTKVEGRFCSIQYVDDSPEVYRLIAELMTTRTNGSSTKKATFTAASKASKQLGLFPDLTQKDLADILWGAHPLEPTTLYLLPRLAARVAQNERSMFDFLSRCPVTGNVEPKDLFDYFSSVMQADTAVGGAYRQWLETQSALSKVADNPTEEEALKTTCLLSLGIAGERFRTSRKLLTFAVRGFSSPNGAEAAIKSLIERKLLLHRKHQDQVAVWHGTDADLRGKLEDEKNRRRASFDLVPYLQKELPSAPWRPVKYNADYGVRRFFASEFHRATSPSLDSQPMLPTADGRVIYLIAEDPQELRVAKRLAKECDDRYVVMVVPARPVPLFELALEVNCLQAMQADPTTVSEDPLVLPELKQMTDDARVRLNRLVERIVRPAADGSTWYYRGKKLPLKRDADVRRQLSSITRKNFNKTPKLLNEMIVRRKPSPVVVNSRKKLVMAILERSGTEGLGIEGNFPDASIFRTVLVNTGLYRKDGKHWRYAEPSEIDDPGLREVWTRIRRFVVEPAERVKRPAKLISTLRTPPIGLRDGVVPILLAAGLKAFPGMRTLTRDGRYVEDLTPSEIELLCREPQRYALKVYEIDEAKAKFLRGLVSIFGGKKTRSKSADLVRHAFDTMVTWRDSLPPAGLSTNQLSAEGRTLQRVIQVQSDPVSLFLDRFSADFREPVAKPKALLAAVERGAAALTGVVPGYLEKARLVVEAELATGQSFKTLRERCRWWASSFDQNKLRHELNGPAKGFLQRLTTDYDHDHDLLAGIAAAVGMPIPRRWDDTSPRRFAASVRAVIQEIEEAALRTGVGSDILGELVEGRMQALLDRFVQVQGAPEARALLDRLREERLT